MGVGSSSITSSAQVDQLCALLDELFGANLTRLRDVPGTPKTSLPNSIASRAVISDPLYCALSAPHAPPGDFPVRQPNRCRHARSAWWWWKGAQYSGSLITARLAMEFGREVFGVPGNVTQPVRFAPNQLIKQGAKLVTCAEDVIEELPTPIRAALVQAEKPEAEQRSLLAAAALNGSEKKLYELPSAEETGAH